MLVVKRGAAQQKVSEETKFLKENKLEGIWDRWLGNLASRQSFAEEGLLAWLGSGVWDRGKAETRCQLLVS